MEYNIKDNALTIFFEGEINSNNAEEIENKINEITSNNSFEKLILNFDSLLLDLEVNLLNL